MPLNLYCGIIKKLNADCWPRIKACQAFFNRDGRAPVFYPFLQFYNIGLLVAEVYHWPDFHPPYCLSLPADQTTKIFGAWRTPHFSRAFYLSKISIGSPAPFSYF